MSIAPEVGTAPRPDVTGDAKYDAAPLELGMGPAPIDAGNNYSVPWGAFVVTYDFPETKYPVEGYEVMGSIHADFQVNEADADKDRTGLCTTPEAAEFSSLIIAMTALGTGNPVIGMREDTLFFVKVRALITIDPGVSSYPSEWSETLVATTAPLPNPNGMRADENGNMQDLAPVASFTAVPASLSVAITDTSVVNPISSAALFDIRVSCEGVATQAMLPGAAATLHSFAEAGFYPVTIHATDANGVTGTYTAIVEVQA